LEQFSAGVTFHSITEEGGFRLNFPSEFFFWCDLRKDKKFNKTSLFFQMEIRRIFQTELSIEYFTKDKVIWGKFFGQRGIYV
jgi:hypothetical protein